MCLSRNIPFFLDETAGVCRRTNEKYWVLCPRNTPTMEVWKNFFVGFTNCQKYSSKFQIPHCSPTPYPIAVWGKLVYIFENNAWLWKNDSFQGGYHALFKQKDYFCPRANAKYWIPILVLSTLPFPASLLLSNDLSFRRFDFFSTKWILVANIKKYKRKAMI